MRRWGNGFIQAGASGSIQPKGASIHEALNWQRRVRQGMVPSSRRLHEISLSKFARDVVKHLTVIMATTRNPERKVPALAGLCTMEAAMRPGLAVEECVRRLKRFHYVFKRLHHLLTARLTAEPMYELKLGFSYHAYLCAEQVTALRRRVGEMREPPLGLDVVPDTQLELCLDEVLCAKETSLLIAGVYAAVMPALQEALGRYMADTNPLADQPSMRACRLALADVEEMRVFGEQVLLADEFAGGQPEHKEFAARLGATLSAAGGLDGTRTASVAQERVFSAQPYKYVGSPRRDARFPDPYNMGVNAEVFLYDERQPAKAKMLMMFYKRLREIDVPEMMAGILTETEGKPWEYYRDMARQLWDEARHAMMGEVGFAQTGVDWSRVMVNFTWSLALNTQLTPLERHAVLYFIEQGLMPRNGKRYEWEVARQTGNALAATIQDFDWADEVLHARIGRDWYLKEFDDPRQAVHFGDLCWSKVLMNWETWRRQGLTEHRNWWPDVYRQACQQWGEEPDPRAMGYAVSYETVRADLKPLKGSG